MRFDIATLSILLLIAQSACVPGVKAGEVNIQMETADTPDAFVFPTIKRPAINDAGSQGKWFVLKGKPDDNSAAITVLNDGTFTDSDDSPAENFFFAAGTDGGSVVVDLGSVQSMEQIVSYSRHASTRAPQVFTVWTATGQEPNFSATSKADPAQSGWKSLAKVDSRTLPRGSQHAVSITADNKTLGDVRFVRFDITATENRDAFGNTFFSEIDILTAGGAEIKRQPLPPREQIVFGSSDQRFQFAIDTTAAPDLNKWSQNELKPVIEKWYGKIVDMLPSEGFEAPKVVRFQFLPAEKMQGIPAWAQNATVSMNAGWFRGELKREARGAVVHEMVHVVQDYQRMGRGRRGPPGWIVEGIPDYIRWFLYEPESKGALLSKKMLTNAKHDASYRTTANFIDWVIRTHDSRGDLLQRLNTAARTGKYSSDLWKELTGKTENELADIWRSQ